MEQPRRSQQQLLSVVIGLVFVAMPLAAPAEAQDLENARIFFEYNSTDNDLGVQVFLDADAWQSLTITAPGGSPILQLDASGALGVLGLTELFWESDEPSPAEVLALFPPGEYEFEVVDVGGETLSGTATLSHTLPSPAVITLPVEDSSVNAHSAFVRWTHPQPDQLEAFEVIVGNETTGTQAAAFTLPVSVTRIRVPAAALGEPGDYKVEVLAVGTNGNKTIVEVSFEVK